MQTERNTKRNAVYFCIAEVPPKLLRVSANRAQYKKETQFIFLLPRCRWVGLSLALLSLGVSKCESAAAEKRNRLKSCQLPQRSLQIETLVCHLASVSAENKTVRIRSPSLRFIGKKLPSFWRQSVVFAHCQTPIRCRRGSLPTGCRRCSAPLGGIGKPSTIWHRDVS